MKPAENLTLDRTVGDTDPFFMQLIVMTDDGATPVPSTAEVVMHLKLSPVITLTGTPREAEEDQGFWSFDTAPMIAVTSGTFGFEVEVTDGVIYTVAKGKVNNRPQIA